MPTAPEIELERYLRTGESDPLARTWPGNDVFARARRGDTTLRDALIAEVRRRTPQASVPQALAATDVASFTRSKVEPMVRGLFPADEQETVLNALADSVVFLTPDSIDRVLATTPYLRTAWLLANIYLTSAGADPLSEDAPRIVGLSESTTCFVSADYFDTHEALADFVVHEAAHVFHNCKRRTIGLPEPRRREWLLEIAFSKRETFAYVCEAYSRLLELGGSRASRQALLSEHAVGPMPADTDVDASEYLDILRAAIAARNGWKRILQACAPVRTRRGLQPFEVPVCEADSE